jgi:WD40 repeat protein
LGVSSNRALLAVGCPKKGVLVFDTKTWQQVAQLKTTERVSRIKFSADGSMMVSSGAAGEVKLWDAKTFKLLHDLKGNMDLVNSVAISPDNKRVVTGSDDYTIRFWDVETGLSLLTLRGNPEQLYHAGFSIDGSTLFMSDKHGNVRWLHNN